MQFPLPPLSGRKAEPSNSPITTPLATQHRQAAATYRKTIMFAVLTTVLRQKTTFKQNHDTHGSSVEVSEKVNPDKNYSSFALCGARMVGLVGGGGGGGGKARLTHPRTIATMFGALFIEFKEN